MSLFIEFTLFALSIIGLTAFLAVMMHVGGTTFSKKKNSFRHHLSESKSRWREIKRH